MSFENFHHFNKRVCIGAHACWSSFSYVRVISISGSLNKSPYENITDLISGVHLTRISHIPNAQENALTVGRLLFTGNIQLSISN
jgi:hypothetical protein